MELAFIEWLRRRRPPNDMSMSFLGNDAAELPWRAEESCVVTTDLLAEGVHFRLAETDPARIGQKALAVNYSDLAAMGARPVAYFASLLLPRSTAEVVARGIMEGMDRLAARLGGILGGGDTNTWDLGLVINVTAIGAVPQGRSWSRSGAGVDDVVLVTGELGGSLRGKHLDFMPRIPEATFLREHSSVQAAMDLSDGLSMDGWRLAKESGVALELDAEAIPISDAARAMAAANDPPDHDPLHHALHDGEDFELLLILHPADAATLQQTWPFATRLTQIGRVHAGEGIWLRMADGSSRPLPPHGYEHRGS